MLRAIGVDPPRWHDVGGMLIDHRDKLPPAVAADVETLAAISLRLRRDREAAFCGDIDLIPERVFDREAAQRAIEGAERVLRAVEEFARR